VTPDQFEYDGGREDNHRTPEGPSGDHDTGWGLTVNECQATRYLHADGYSMADIGWFLDCQTVTVSRHVNGECSHPERTPPQKTRRLHGEELRRRRRDAGLTQAELAERLDVGPTAVSSWESDRAKPRRDTAYRLWQALNLDVDQEGES